MATAYLLTPLVWKFDRTNPPGVNVDNPENRMVFDDTTSEICRLVIELPPNFSGGLVIRGKIAAVPANTGTKVCGIGVAVDAKDTAENIASETFDTENTIEITVNNTANTQVDWSLALTNADSAAASDRLVIKLRRVTTGLTGTNAVGDVVIEPLILEYTTT